MRFAHLLLFFLLMTNIVRAQSPYLSVKDPKHPEQYMLVGSFSMYALANDSNYSWFAAGMKGYKPVSQNVSLISEGKLENHLLIFAGTWCEDSQAILPKLFQLLSASGFPENHISLYGVDREKKSIGNIAAALGITHVPTMIVMKNSREVGRVVEYGKTGNWEKELADFFK